MKADRKYESIFIGGIIVTCLALGIFTNLNYGAITISSLCFAICITCLVYWFLGGIESASINVGYLKLGGSIAALLGGFYFINQELRKDFETTYELRMPDKSYAIGQTTKAPQKVVLLANGKAVDSIQALPDNFFSTNVLDLDKDLNVSGGKFSFGKLSGAALSKNGLFRTVFEAKNKDKPNNYFTINETWRSESLDISVTATRFDGTATFKFETENTTEPAYIEISNKQIKVIEVGGRYFILAATKADFTTAVEEPFMELSIRLLDLK